MTAAQQPGPVHSAAADDVAVVVERLRNVYARWTRTTQIAQMRDDWDDLFRGRARVWPEHRFEAGGVPAEWIVAANAPADRTILYVHGGGFRIGSIESHRDLMQRLSTAVGARVLGINYRLCPEHAFPAPVEDALSAYRWLLDSGVPPGSIALAGDSAGGGLVLACMFAARAANLALPSAALLMSPWTDLAATGATFVSRADVDPLHQRPMILSMAKAYLGPSGDPLDPLASPLYGELEGLPPLLIQCGDCETILDDSMCLADRAAKAGVAVELEVYPSMIHVFQAFGELSAAGRALASAGRFLGRYLTEQDKRPAEGRADTLVCR
ncbi:esterase [Bradyrhizobium macuxiense]|uniref:Esterase n=1 Tax=Bradyrhizobium macuxiense TaxID=1755647 RepID=A0A109JAW3_9BRAD|nr:alpha/beta hydrolase [Bradyrhizobium macuxiense]KWV45565.1 esterase [Bradyrhizobium macuxiense]